MNLKENYERFFGKIEPQSDAGVQPLNESQKTRFQNLSHTLRLKYPNAPITLKNGFVWLGNKKVELVQDFLKRSSLQIHEMVRSFSASGKTGLI